MRRLATMAGIVLLLAGAAWLMSTARQIGDLARATEMRTVLALSALYLVSHLLRMVRLALLTLDTRWRALPAMAAHALTALPSSFLPYKLGEVLRLGAFTRVYGGLRRALAVWLVERFSDVVVIAAFIFALYLLKVRVPDAMHTVFVVFVAASALGLLALFAVSKVFVYLNRGLVLTSHSRRGLAVLKASHALRELEADIQRCVEGRYSGVMLLSLLIWGIEVLAVSLFLQGQAAGGAENIAVLFVSGLLASLPGGQVPGVEGFGLYQSISLMVLFLATLPLAWAGRRLSVGRPA